jgi:hypothetical protein
MNFYTGSVAQSRNIKEKKKQLHDNKKHELQVLQVQKINYRRNTHMMTD